MITGFIVVVGFLWTIHSDIADMRERIGANTPAISANTAAISDMRADISELRGALFAHVGNHSHGTKVAVAETE